KKKRERERKRERKKEAAFPLHQLCHIHTLTTLLFHLAWYIYISISISIHSNILPLSVYEDFKKNKLT
ncbi:hypothetical protein PP707_03145, partial [Acetobacter pasteurianus]|nr:hypothetical protein [Acetobacter pasteurianus]